jgi:hypothetical protein
VDAGRRAEGEYLIDVPGIVGGDCGFRRGFLRREGGRHRDGGVHAARVRWCWRSARRDGDGDAVLCFCRLGAAEERCSGIVAESGKVGCSGCERKTIGVFRAGAWLVGAGCCGGGEQVG